MPRRCSSATVRCCRSASARGAIRPSSAAARPAARRATPARPCGLPCFSSAARSECTRACALLGMRRSCPAVSECSHPENRVAFFVVESRRRLTVAAELLAIRATCLGRLCGRLPLLSHWDGAVWMDHELPSLSDGRVLMGSSFLPCTLQSLDACRYDAPSTPHTNGRPSHHPCRA